MFHTFKNCKIFINDKPIYTQNVDISWQSKPEPSYVIDKKYNTSYKATDGINGQISLSYYITGQDFLLDNISNENSQLSIEFGGLIINSGYLKSYSFNAIPNNPVVVNANLVFFDNLNGNFNPTYEVAPNLQCLNISDAEITSIPGSNSIGSISNITKLNYTYNIDVLPQYHINQSLPSRVVFGPKNVNLTISSDKINGNISLSGNKAAIRTKLVHPENSGIFQNIDCRGILYQKNLTSSVGEILDSTYSIKQHDFGSFNSNQNQTVLKPIIYSIKPTSGFYGTSVTISGKNLSFVGDVAFSDNVFDINFQIINDNQINTTVPNGAVSGPITVYSDIGSATSSQIFRIGGLPITINGLIPITGRFGSTVLISGDNFYEISSVVFNSGISSQFTRLNKNLINAIVPNNSAWGKINVISSFFSLTGTSLNEFVPIPDIFGFNPISGLSGEFILISGQGFSGVTGVKINNLPAGNTDVFSVIGNTGILVQVPSGNTKGYINLFGQSGVTSLSLGQFYPYAKITGVIPASGRTGDLIGVSGLNFIPEILYGFGANSFAVGFAGNVTGHFYRINNTTLSGSVPSGARSGIIHIYSPSQEEYPSNVFFNVRPSAPIINSISPSSGKFQDVISIIGSNFYNVNSILITGGLNTGVRITSNFSVSNSNDYINFTTPSLSTITGGTYNLYVIAAEGSGSGTFGILGIPYISGYRPISGGGGLEINISGLNLYGNLTHVYIDNTGIQTSLNTGSFTGDHTRLSFYMPSNLSSGLHKIILNNSVGFVTGVPDFNFVPAPVISGFSPLSGQWGDRIMVTGQYFNSVFDVKIGDFAVTNYNIVSSTGLYLIIPETSTNFIKLTNTGGQGISSQQLIIVPPLIIVSGFKENPTYYNSGLVISGLYLNTLREVRFSGLNSGENIVTNFTGVAGTGVYLTVPAGITSGYLKLVNDRGISYSSTILTLIPSPIIGLIDTQTGVFKDLILISGTNLNGSIVYFNSANNVLVTGDNILRINDTGIQVNVPHEIISGPIIVKGRNDVLVQHTGNFVILPTISGISGNLTYPTGSYITLTGINAYEAITFLGISGSTGNYVEIDLNNDFINNTRYVTGIGYPGTGYSLITARIGTGFAGTGRLFLVSSNDNLIMSGITNSHTFNFKNKVIFGPQITISQPAPTINNINPTGGSKNTTVTISGTSLISTNNVYFNVGLTYTSGSIISVSDNRVVVKPPFISLGGSGTGLVFLTTPFGTTLSGIFKLLPLLSISGYNPTQGHTGDYIRITGSGLRGVTGVKFGPYNAAFNTVDELGTVVLSGIIPNNFNCCSEIVQICVSNEGEEYCL